VLLLKLVDPQLLESQHFGSNHTTRSQAGCHREMTVDGVIDAAEGWFFASW
jgi:hypothetical protein